MHTNRNEWKFEINKEMVVMEYRYMQTKYFIRSEGWSLVMMKGKEFSRFYSVIRVGRSQSVSRIVHKN